jgi:hypothetical protein
MGGLRPTGLQFHNSTVVWDAARAAGERRLRQAVQRHEVSCRGGECALVLLERVMCRKLMFAAQERIGYESRDWVAPCCPADILFDDVV